MFNSSDDDSNSDNYDETVNEVSNYLPNIESSS